MGCGPSNSANAAVEPLSIDTAGAEISRQSTNPKSEAKTPKLQASKKIGMNENAKAANFPNETAGPNGKHQNSNGTGPFPAQNGTSTPQSAYLPSATQSSPAAAGVEDPQWKELWLAYKDMLLDPADVHATLQDLMANATNRLSDVELLFLQRRVRSTVRQSQMYTEQQSGGNGSKTRKSKRRGSGSSGSGPKDTYSIAKNHHLLTASVLNTVLPQPPVPMVKCNLDFLAANFPQSLGIVESKPFDENVGDITSATAPLGKSDGSISSTSIRTIETTYLLALFCNDVLWDNVAEIAVDSAKANGLEMDVNKIVIESKDKRNSHSNLPQLPVPTEPICERTPEMPLGMGMHSLTFILGLALRKWNDEKISLRIIC